MMMRVVNLLMMLLPKVMMMIVGLSVDGRIFDKVQGFVFRIFHPTFIVIIFVHRFVRIVRFGKWFRILIVTALFSRCDGMLLL
jgi:hypothetical protein